MKKVLFALLVVISALGASSCEHDPDFPYPNTKEYPQIYTNVSTENAFKLAEVQSSGSATARFDIQVQGGNPNEVEAIQVYRQFVGFNVPTGTAAPAVGVGGPTVLLRTVPPTSATIELTIDEVIQGLTRATGATQAGARTALTRGSLRAGEGFRFTYALLLKDGTVIQFNPTFLNAPFSGIVTVVQ
jgi:subtilisin family serine protease